MALIKCKECGKEISDKSDICPHCGYSNKNNTHNSKINSISNQLKTGSIVSLISCSIIIIILLGFILMGYFLPANGSHQTSGNANLSIELTPSSIPLNNLFFFGISVVLALTCFIIIILFLSKKLKNIKLYKFLLLSMAIIQLICAIISIGVLMCCGMIYVIFPLINVIGAIIVATEK